jgi:cell division septation protein DedD
MKQEPVQAPVVSLPVEPAVVIQDEPVAPSKPVVKSQASPVSSKKFYIIGGCFESHENAYKFLSELKNRGFEAEEAGTNQRGHLRISYKSFPGRQEALIYLDEIKARENPAAWLLKY